MPSSALAVGTQRGVPWVPHLVQAPDDCGSVCDECRGVVREGQGARSWGRQRRSAVTREPVLKGKGRCQQGTRRRGRTGQREQPEQTHRSGEATGMFRRADRTLDGEAGSGKRWG